MLAKLVEHYGRDIPGAQYGLSCKQNALYNGCLAIGISMPIQILYLDTPDLAHAYLSDRIHAYSYQLTWRNRDIPERSLIELSRLGASDITQSLLMSALSYLQNTQNAYTSVLEKLDRKIPGLANEVYNFVQSNNS